jgi:hypothetical protein
MFNFKKILKKGITLDKKKKKIFIKLLKQHKKNLIIFSGGIDIDQLIKDIKDYKKNIVLEWNFSEQKNLQKQKYAKKKPMIVHVDKRIPISAVGGVGYEMFFRSKCSFCWILILLFTFIIFTFNTYFEQGVIECEINDEEIKTNQNQRLDLVRGYRREMNSILDEPLKLLGNDVKFIEEDNYSEMLEDGIGFIEDINNGIKSQYYSLFGNKEQKTEIEKKIKKKEEKNQKQQYRVERRKYLNKELKKGFDDAKLKLTGTLKEKIKDNEYGLIEVDEETQEIMIPFQGFLDGLNEYVMTPEIMEKFEAAVLNNNNLAPENKILVTGVLKDEFMNHQKNLIRLSNALPNQPKSCQLYSKFKDSSIPELRDGYIALAKKSVQQSLVFGFMLSNKIMRDAMEHKEWIDENFYHIGVFYGLVLFGLNGIFIGFKNTIKGRIFHSPIKSILDFILGTTTFGYYRLWGKKKRSIRGGKKKNSKKIRKHKGINQKTGRLNKGYKYSDKKLKSGLRQIIKKK